MTAAVIVADSDDRAQWLAARRHGIGASEIAAVMGLSPWESPFSLFWRKLNGWDIETTDTMRTGTLLEPVIADWWAYQAMEDGLGTGDAGLLFAHPERPWQLATPDRLVRDIFAQAVAVLECKWVAQSWDGWGPAGTDQIPVYYRTQVLWQLDVIGVDDWYLAALGPGGFREYCGRRDAKDLRIMREAGRRFMDRLNAGTPPPVDDHLATLAAVKQLNDRLDDTTVEVPADLAANYARALRMARLADTAKRRYEVKLRDAMGRAKRATSGGAFVASRSIFDVAAHTVPKHTVDRLNPPRAKKAA